MSKERASNVSRRVFLNAGLTTAAVTTGCLRFGLEELLAQSVRTKKPLLSDTNLNRLVNNQARKNKLTEFGEAKADPLAFLEKRFTVADEQRRQYEALSKEDKDTIGRAIDVMAKENGIVKWHFVTRKKQSGSRVILKLFRSTEGGAPSFFVPPETVSPGLFLPPVKGE